MPRFESIICRLRKVLRKLAWVHADVCRPSWRIFSKSNQEIFDEKSPIFITFFRNCFGSRISIVSLVACACLDKLKRINLLSTPKLFCASFDHKVAWPNIQSINKCHLSDGIRLYECTVITHVTLHPFHWKLRCDSFMLWTALPTKSPLLLTSLYHNNQNITWK